MSQADLLPQVYEELRRLAAAKLAHERGDHTLDTTALVAFRDWLDDWFLRAAGLTHRGDQAAGQHQSSRSPTTLPFTIPSKRNSSSSNTLPTSPPKKLLAWHKHHLITGK